MEQKFILPGEKIKRGLQDNSTQQKKTKFKNFDKLDGV